MISLITSSTTDPRDMTCLSPSHSSLFLIYVSSPGLVTRVTQWVLQVDHAFLFLPEHMSSLPDFQWDTWCSFFCRLLCALFLVIIIILYVLLWFTVYDIIIIFSLWSLVLYVLFYLAIVLSVFLRYTDSDCHFWYLQTLLGSVPINLYYLVTSGEIRVSFEICSHS
jgi:hypothetical protein